MKLRKGFTLAELLIVIAIIAVLVAIAIPTFSAALDGARLAVDATTERNALTAANIQYLAFQNELEVMTNNIKDLEKRKQGWYFFYNPATGGLTHANDYDGSESDWDSFKIGKWGDHKGKYLMVLIKLDGTVLFRWGPEAPYGSSVETNWGFGPPPSIAELEKRRG